MSKVLIFYTAHSIGHKRIAENFGYWFKSLGWEVELKDAFGIYSNDGAVSKFLKLHLFIYQRAAFLWRWLYNWGYVFFFPFRLLAARLYISKVLGVISSIQPDLVITTQTSPSAVLAVIKQRGLWKGRWAIGFSDYHFHPFWVYSRADGYLVNIEEQKQALVRRGLTSLPIAVGGMWLRPNPNVDTDAVRRKLGIPARAKVVLVAAGSGGWVSFDKVLDALRQVVALGEKSGHLITPVLLCGRNEVFIKKIRGAVPSTWLALPFYEPLDDLYALADLFLTKPGGLSIAEALQWQLPCFIPFLLQGQENLNLTYLNKHSLVYSLFDKSQDEWALEIYEELMSGQVKRLLQNNQSRVNVAGSDLRARLENWLNTLFHG